MLTRAALGAILVVAACAPAGSLSEPRPDELPVGETPAWMKIECASAIGSPADASDDPGFSTRGWQTDFSQRCVPLSEITSGGPGRDGIPPIDEPQFVDAAAAERWLDPREPVMAVVEGDEAKAYPLQILIWHEIVNDTVGGRPLAVTYCPLCNTAIVFDRVLDGRELTFGTTGNLRYSDLVMWDRQTESWWQQATGEAIVGELTGRTLVRVPVLVLSFEEFMRAYPDGLVLDRERTGHSRPYGTNPYGGYDRPESGPLGAFWGAQPIDERLPPKARVAVATFSDPPVAYPLHRLESATAVNDAIGDRAIVLLFLPGTASALDTNAISEGKDVGQAGVFDPMVDGRLLTFRPAGDGFVDEQTNSTWLVSGLATAGPLAGTRLALLEHEIPFWFSWAVFRPDTEIREP